MTILQALADERKMLQAEYDADSLEIKRIIEHRFEKWLALERIKREMRAIGKDLEP